MKSDKTEAEIKEVLTKIETFIVDLDGTIYLGNKLFPWSMDFIRSVKANNKNFVFVTNNSSRSKQSYVEKLAKMGVEISPQQVFTSGEATIYYLQKNGFGSPIYLLGTENLEAEFVSAGFGLDNENPTAVVLGFDMSLTYEKLETACHLIRQGVPFVATHPDINCPTPNGPIPDCGAMISLITASTGVKPKIIGKPNLEMVDALENSLGVSRTALAMVGDRLYTDIAMGNRAEMTSILVLSGEASLEDLKDSPNQPDIVLDNIGQIAQYL